MYTFFLFFFIYIRYYIFLQVNLHEFTREIDMTIKKQLMMIEDVEVEEGKKR